MPTTHRYISHLRTRYRIVLAFTGLICAIIGLVMLLPLLMLIFFPVERTLAAAFLSPGLFLVVIGVLVWRWLLPPDPTLTHQEGAVIVVLSWAIALVMGGIPLRWVLELTPLQAFFESVSAWTTTGLSVVDVSTAPKSILFYRSTLQLAGGAGFAIIALSALTGPTGLGISLAEGRELLVPHIQRSASLVLSIYGGYVVVGIPALALAGMSWFDAVNHAFAALSTGGFSTHPESIGYWDSALIEGVVIVLMLLGTLNFVTAYALLRGKFRSVLRNGELHLMAWVIPLCVIAIFFLVSWSLYPTLGKGVRVAIFETITALSSTGFNTIDYRAWPGFGWLLLLLLMLIGGGTGSTAGAIKQFRIYVLYRALRWEITRMFLPKQVVTEPDVWIGETRHFLTDARVRQIGLFVFIYLITFFVGSAVIAAHGYSLQESLFEFASAIGTIGLSVGVTAPDAPAGVLGIEIAGMILGRLEFFTIIIGVGKLFTDLRDYFNK
ncbi:MAG: TrkH family potassium uptake protein [Chloroflexi bacterium]|nr:TrkH family potassium uptake protein [Chloroflexota bacterium]